MPIIMFANIFHICCVEGGYKKSWSGSASEACWRWWAIQIQGFTYTLTLSMLVSYCCPSSNLWAGYALAADVCQSVIRRLSVRFRPVVISRKLSKIDP